MDQFAFGVNSDCMVDPGEIPELAIIFAVMNDKVRALACFKRSDFIAQSQAPGRIDRRGGDRLRRRHFQIQLVVGGATLHVADIYDRPLDLIHLQLLAYWGGKGEYRCRSDFEFHNVFLSCSL